MKRFAFALLALLCTHNPAVAGCGAYFSGIGGADFLHLKKSDFAELKMDTGFLIGATVGYQFCCGLAVEAELAYRRENPSTLRFNAVTMEVDDEFLDFDGIDIRANGLSEATTIMVNLVYYMDCIQFCLPYIGDIVPYTGIGVGYAHSHELICFDLPTGIFGGYATDDTFAYQAIFGLSTAIDCCTDVGIEYRRMAHHQNTYNQSVNLMVKRYF